MIVAAVIALPPSSLCHHAALPSCSKRGQRRIDAGASMRKGSGRLWPPYALDIAATPGEQTGIKFPDNTKNDSDFLVLAGSAHENNFQPNASSRRCLRGNIQQIIMLR
jgi:hypothetical protein